MDAPYLIELFDLFDLLAKGGKLERTPVMDINVVSCNKWENKSIYENTDAVLYFV